MIIRGKIKRKAKDVRGDEMRIVDRRDGETKQNTIGLVGMQC